MSIAESFGNNVEIATFNKKAEINNQTIIHQMNSTINNSGDGNIINTGNENQIKNIAYLYKSDITRLQNEMEKQGIDKMTLQKFRRLLH